MAKERCIPCEVDGIARDSIEIIDGIPMCKTHVAEWKIRFKELVNGDTNKQDSRDTISGIS